MPTDPGSDLQDALLSILRAAPNLIAMVGDRVYDLRETSPQNAVYPYVALGESSSVFAHYDQYSDAENVFVVHCWSRESSFREVRQLGRAVEAALNRSVVEEPTSRVQSILSASGQIMRDPDGVSSHGTFRFHVLTESRA